MAFRTRLTTAPFAHGRKPAISAKDLYADLVGAEPEVGSPDYLLTLSSARKIVRASDSPRRINLLRHIEGLERKN